MGEGGGGTAVGTEDPTAALGRGVPAAQPGMDTSSMGRS